MLVLAVALGFVVGVVGLYLLASRSLRLEAGKVRRVGGIVLPEPDDPLWKLDSLSGKASPGYPSLLVLSHGDRLRVVMIAHVGDPFMMIGDWRVPVASAATYCRHVIVAWQKRVLSRELSPDPPETARPSQVS